MKSAAVIIVTYNGENWIKKCLESIRASTIQVKIYVVDNHSSDETVSIIKENFHKVFMIHMESNIGFGQANNMGISHAIHQGHEYIFLVNQDVYVSSDTFEQLLAEYKNGDYGILSPIHLNGNGTKIDQGFVGHIYKENGLELLSLLMMKTAPNIYQVQFANAASWLLSKQVLEIVGGFDPIFQHYGEDNHLIQRAAFYGFKTGICTNTYINHDREGRPMTADRSEYQKTYRQHLLTLTNPNIKFSVACKIAFSTLIKQCIKAILRLNFYNSLIFYKVIYRLIFKLESIKKSRKKSTSGLNLLYLKKLAKK